MHPDNLLLSIQSARTLIWQPSSMRARRPMMALSTVHFSRVAAVGDDGVRDLAVDQLGWRQEAGAGVDGRLGVVELEAGGLQQQLSCQTLGRAGLVCVSESLCDRVQGTAAGGQVMLWRVSAQPADTVAAVPAAEPGAGQGQVMILWLSCQSTVWHLVKCAGDLENSGHAYPSITPGTALAAL